MKLLKHLPRFQRAYRELDKLAERETWSREELTRWQLDRLNVMWQHAIGHVPYYARLADEQRSHARPNLPDRLWPR
jgi:phenylacetate-coenzyme A ligase PaaK-like adenylate-forming protein